MRHFTQHGAAPATIPNWVCRFDIASDEGRNSSSRFRRFFRSGHARDRSADSIHEASARFPARRRPAAGDDDPGNAAISAIGKHLPGIVGQGISLSFRNNLPQSYTARCATQLRTAAGSNGPLRSALPGTSKGSGRNGADVVSGRFRWPRDRDPMTESGAWRTR